MLRDRFFLTAGGRYNAYFVNNNEAGLIYNSSVTGLSANNLGILSFWISFNASSASQKGIVCDDGTSEFQATRFGTVSSPASTYAIELASAGGGDVYSFRTSTLSNSVTYHILASWNTDAAPGSRVSNLYVNDVSDKTILTNTGSAFDVGFTNPEIRLLSQTRTVDTSTINAKIGEVYLNIGEYLDFSVEANRRKFISEDGFPAPLGETGATPTGTQPIIYQKNIFSSFNVNSGSGGNFTTVGSFTNGGAIPQAGT